MKRVFIFFMLIAIFAKINAQKSNIFLSPFSDYNEAVELYNKSQYTASLALFQKITKDNKYESPELIIDAKFYSALCAIKLYHANAEFEVYTLLKQYPNNTKTNIAIFELGKYEYQKQQYHKAVQWFEKTDKYSLSSDDQSEYYFKLAYSYFILQKRDTARVFFYEIKDVDTKYTSPSIYYYSHINYSQKNYQTALEGFLRLIEDETFAPIVPYYIAQIYYLQGKYDKVLEYAPPLLETVTKKRRGEMKSIIGDAHFRLKQYKECIPYFEEYIQEELHISRETKYQLGYSYYWIHQYDSAISILKEILDRDDELTQNALYHLGLSYIAVNEKEKAMMSFSFASNLDFNANIKRESLFNYCKLSYELSYSPFNEVIKAFNKYIELYPYSPNIKEVYAYLVQVYLSTRNYLKALEFLEKIEFKDDDIKIAYQRVAFYRGLELYNDQDIKGAKQMLDKSLEYGKSDELLQARTYYWKGEISYKEGDFPEAIDLYDKFLSSPSTINSDEYYICHYNIAYAYFKVKNYSNSAFWFNKFISIARSTNQHTVADSYNRLGDIAFIKTDYIKAINNYENNIKINIFASDYSTFQKGFCQGLLRDYNTKIETLESLISTFSHSEFIDDAIFEIARTYEVLNNSKEALSYYNKLLKEYTNSSYQAKALVQIGLINYNADDNNAALSYYKKVVEDYPGTEESKNALLGIKNIYVEQGNVEPYYTYIASLNYSIAGETEAAKDSATFNAAVNTYMSGNCNKALISFENYINKYKNGSYLLHAHFYEAECYFKNKEYDKALDSYSYIIEQTPNIFSEQALSGAALINFTNKNYKEALENYTELEKVSQLKSTIRDAILGKMRCDFYLNDYQMVIDAAQFFFQKDNRSEELKREAYYIVATSYYNLNEIEKALENYLIVAKDINSEKGAESKYKVAKIYFMQSENDKAQNEILDFAKQNTSHEYWLAKSFLLMSDILIAKNDVFQATATLKSVIENYENKSDGILDEATTKLKLITAEDIEKDTINDDIEIKINN